MRWLPLAWEHRFGVAAGSVKNTLEVYALGAKRRWGTPEIHQGAARVHAPPFEAVELDLAAIWVPVLRRLK